MSVVRPGRSGRVIAPGDLRHDANMFTIIRWVLASSVLFTHGFAFTGHPEAADPTTLALPFPVSRLAVLLFFSLSGFLVAGSLIKRGITDFAVARALRLIPGAWMMLAVTTIVLGLWFNDGTFAELVLSPSLHRYIINNMLFLGRAYSLDGVLTHNPEPMLANGSLWTLRHEVRCYAVLAIVGAVGLLASRRVLTAGFVVYLIVDLIVPADAVNVLSEPRPLALSFFFGVLLYLWRERVFLSWPLAAAVVAGALLLPAGALSDAATGLAFAYAALVAAILVPARWKAASAALPDYSYGIYIYGCPAQQVAYALGIAVTPYANFAVGFAIVVPLAALSWHLVEKPALALKPRFTRSVPVRPALDRPA